MSGQDQMHVRVGRGRVGARGESLGLHGSDLSQGQGRQEDQPGRCSDVSAVFGGSAKPVGNPGAKVPC